MRLVVCLILATVLLQGAFAVTSKATQKKMMLEKINRQMEQSHMGRAMKNMVTLATKLNYSLDDLEVAFNNLSSQLLGRKETENNQYDQQSLDHSNNVELINNSINRYTQAVADGEATVASLTAQLEQQQNTLNGQRVSLQQNQDNLAAAQEEKVVLVQNHDQEVQDYNNALEVLAEAVGLLNQAQSNYEGAGLEQYSFAQVKSTLTAFVQKMQTATKKMRASHQLFVKPVILAMNQLSSGSNQSSVQGAVNALNDLSAYFSQALAAANVIFTNELENVNNRISQFEQQIDLLSNTLIPQSEADVARTQGELEVAQAQLVQDRQSLADAQQALVDENVAFDNITRRHNAVVQKVSEEYAIVIRAQQIVNEARQNLEV